MKQRFKISIIFTFLLLSLVPLAQAQKKTKAGQESKSKQTSFKWTTFTLPTTVGQLIALYGNYAKFIPCPQEEDCNYFTYEWKINNGLIIDAWAIENISEKANKQQKIGAYELSAKNSSVINNLAFQLSLNKSSLTECKKKFNLKESTPNTWKFQQNNVFTYLYFNDNDILIKIGQYPFDRDSVG